MVAVLLVPFLGLNILGHGWGVLGMNTADLHMLGVTMLVFGVGLLVSGVGLFLRRRWSLNLYLLSMAGGMITLFVIDVEALKFYMGGHESATPWGTIIKVSLVVITLLTLPVLPIVNLLNTGHEI